MSTLETGPVGYNNMSNLNNMNNLNNLNNLIVNYDRNEDYVKNVNIDLSIVKQETGAYTCSPIAIKQQFVYHQATGQHNQMNSTPEILSTNVNYENSSPQLPPTPPSPINASIENYRDSSSQHSHLNQASCQLDYQAINFSNQVPKHDLVNKSKRKNANLKPYTLCSINGVNDQLTRQQIRANNSVAKRNERERKRVKNVNLGFQKLRNHIPNNAKKMSKVETLRSAVKYIRQLQEILNESGQSDHTTELLFNILNNNQYTCSNSSPAISNLETCNSNSTLDYFDISDLLS